MRVSRALGRDVVRVRVPRAASPDGAASRPARVTAQAIPEARLFVAEWDLALEAPVCADRGRSGALGSGGSCPRVRFRCAVCLAACAQGPVLCDVV